MGLAACVLEGERAAIPELRGGRRRSGPSGALRLPIISADPSSAMRESVGKSRWCGLWQEAQETVLSLERLGLVEELASQSNGFARLGGLSAGMGTGGKPRGSFDRDHLTDWLVVTRSSTSNGKDQEPRR